MSADHPCPSKVLRQRGIERCRENAAAGQEIDIPVELFGLLFREEILDYLQKRREARANARSKPDE